MNGSGVMDKSYIKLVDLKFDELAEPDAIISQNYIVEQEREDFYKAVQILRKYKKKPEANGVAKRITKKTEI